MNWRLKIYQLKGNPLIENVPVIGNLVYDEVGKALIRKYNEIFKGTPAEHKIKYKTGDTITNSNTPLALGLNHLLLNDSEFSGLSLRVLTPVDIIQYWNKIPERSFTYADSNSIVIYPNEGPNEELRKQVLEIIGVENPKVPLIVSNLGVERADKEAYKDYGFQFKDSNFLVTEAEFLRKNGKLALKDGEIVSSNEGIPIYTPDSQSGLRWLCRYWDELNARNGDLLFSGGYGRVHLIQDPKGVGAENFQQAYDTIKKQSEKEKCEIDDRVKKAMEYIKTGRFQ